MRATYKDIAERASVSTATVSHVLRGTRFVSPPVREKVLEAARSLEYVPNGLASGLRRQSTGTIGFITSELTNPFYADLAVAAEGLLRERGYAMMISNTFNDPESEKTCIESMAEHRVDGLLLTSVQMESQTWRWLNKHGAPFVLLNRRFATVEAPYAGVDNFGAMRAVVEHLASLGHSRIGFISGFSHSSSAKDRYLGYLRALRDHGLQGDPKLYFEGSYDVRSGIEGAASMFSLPVERRPTAIAASNDLSALGTMQWANETGIRVPDELSITGFDDIELAKLGFVELTTVKQPLHELGRTAARMLSELIEGRPLETERVVLPCELVVRSSTAESGGR